MKKGADTIVYRLPTRQQIAERAHAIFRERGSQPGREIDDWLQAEYELMQLPLDKLAAIDQARIKKNAGHGIAVVSLAQAAMLLAATGVEELVSLNRDGVSQCPSDGLPMRFSTSPEVFNRPAYWLPLPILICLMPSVPTG